RSSSVGQPVEFVQGQFAGQTMRAELHELQKADLGRKYARKDRRPLDPPPVVQLKLFRVYNVDTDREVEEEIQNYDEVQNFGLLCHIDLFQIPNMEDDMPTAFPDSVVPSFPNPNAPSVSFLTTTSVFPNFAGPSMPHTRYSDSDPELQERSSSLSSSFSYAPQDSESDIVAYIGDYPIRESAKCTHEVAGATFVQANEVVHIGRKVLMFVFSDLAVKREGMFILRYRFFDIFSRARDHTDLAVLAECYGGPFRVYSTKEFPGLQASTALTKQISLWGVRTNLRETERKRRKK
ncbi:hypothetical protein GLOTRDRAFT_11626, partial [Gloeophyllum trabeum ATCC 11539]